MNFLVLDIETTGLDPLVDKLHGVGASWPDGRLEYAQREPSSEMKLWLKNPDANIVGHNLRFDIKFLVAAGIEVRAKLWDTKLLAQLLNENQELGLKPLSVKFFGPSSLDSKRELDRAVSSINGRSVADLCRVDIESSYKKFTPVISEYCLEDCANTRNLWNKLAVDIKDCDAKVKSLGIKYSPLDYYMDETIPLERVLIGMELRGIAVDTQALVRYRVQVQAENDQLFAVMNELGKGGISAIEDRLYQVARGKKKSEQGKANVQISSEKYGTKFNWQSSDHVAELLFGYLQIPSENAERTTTGKLSTSEDALAVVRKECYEGSVAGKILDAYATWKKNLKILTTYTGEDKGLLSHVINGRIHADYLQAGHGKESSQGGTVTGRLSSRNPNMQNLPRGSEIKRFFVPDPGHVFIYYDYSQLELRLAAHLSQDPLLKKAYQDGLDLHQITATKIGEERQTAKNINFAMIYDASPWRLADMLQRSPEECKQIIQAFYGLYPGYARYLAAQRTKMLRTGYVISELGRVRRLPELLNPNASRKEVNHAIKQGYNFPIQSLGASITKRGMIELAKRGYKIMTQVHDSVVIQVKIEDCHAALKEIVTIAEGIYPQCSVPLKVDAKVLTSLHEDDKLKETTNEQQRSNDQQDSSGIQSVTQRG